MLETSNRCVTRGILAAIAGVLVAAFFCWNSSRASARPGYPSVAFSTLAGFLYDPGKATPPKASENTLLARFLHPRPAAGTQIPAAVAALDQKVVTIQGFVIPLDFKNGTTSHFMLSKDITNCCYSRIPRMNEWIAVTMKNGMRARVFLDRVVTVSGTLSVGEEFQNGELLSIYRMEATDVIGPDM